MNFTYSNIINVGSHLGNLKKNYNKQMGFYALGFRKNIYIFNTYKILMNIINILTIFRKLILYKCSFMGFSTKENIDKFFFIKKFFYKFNQPWLLGRLVGGSISNKNISLWKDIRRIDSHENYYYRSDLSTDSYFIINNYNTNNVLSELLNDFSILMSVNDSNIKIDGLTYVLPLNTKSIQSLYFLFKVIENFLIKEVSIYKKVELQNKNLNFYSLYLARLLKLRNVLHKSKFFINTFRKRNFKKALAYNSMLLESNYKFFNSFLKKAKFKKKRFYRFYKIYIRNRVKSLSKDIFFKRWSFYAYKNIVDGNSNLINNKTNLNYYNFGKGISLLRSFRYFSFFIKNKRIYNKIIDYSKYRYFIDKSISNKNFIKSSIFYKNPRFFNFYLAKNFKSFYYNKLYLSKIPKNIKSILTVYKYFKKHKIFHSYILPKEWTFYMKYNVYSKKIFKTEDRWFLNYDKHLQKKHQKRFLKRKLNMKKRLETFDKRFNKRFNSKKFKNKKFNSKQNYSLSNMNNYSKSYQKKVKHSKAYLDFKKKISIYNNNNNEKK